MDNKFNRNEKPVSSKKGFMNKVGETIEHAGDRIADAGATTLGKKIHDAGDRIEKTHGQAKPSSGKKDY